MRRLTVLALASLALPAPASAAASRPVFVEPYLGQGPAQVRPHQILLAEDGTLSLYAIHYQTYGGATATSTGHAYTRGCTPDCAQGKVRRPRARIRLSQLTRCGGKLIYARLQYSLSGPIPSGFKRRSTFDLRPVGEAGEPVC